MKYQKQSCRPLRSSFTAWPCYLLNTSQLLGDRQTLIISRPAGTSSILAGALLAAVYRCTGRTYTTDSLNHAILYLEQMLTTGISSVKDDFLFGVS